VKASLLREFSFRLLFPVYLSKRHGSWLLVTTLFSFFPIQGGDKLSEHKWQHMLGITATLRQREKAQSFTQARGRAPGGVTVRPQDVPGFAKWIAAEVYIEDTMAESALETLSLKMVENIEWINEAVADVMSNTGKLVEEPVEAQRDEEQNEEGKLNEEERNDTLGEGDHHMPDIPDASPQDEDILLETTSNSFLLLKSPRKIRNHSSSPIKEARKREFEILKNTTTMILEMDDNRRALQGDTTSITGDAKLLDDDREDSFELISKGIRKSYAAKQNPAVPHPKERELKTAAVEDAQVVSSAREKTPSKFIDNPKLRRAEEEIKELSRLIEGVDVGLSSEDDEGNLTIEIERLEKIELAGRSRSRTFGEVQTDNELDSVEKDHKPPIKFSEMPMIEPLTIGSTRKKSLKKSLVGRKRSRVAPQSSNLPQLQHHEQSQTQNQNRSSVDPRSSIAQRSLSHSVPFLPARSPTPTLPPSKLPKPVGTGIVKKPFGTPTVFREKRYGEENAKSRRRSIHLNPLPNDFAAANISVEEPTIKLDRNLIRHEYQQQQHLQNQRRPPHMQEKEPENGDSKSDFISRLMQPTQASRQKSVKSPLSRKTSMHGTGTSTASTPYKSSKTSRKTTPGKHPKVKQESELDFEHVHKIPAKEHTTISIATTTVKGSMPLTRKSLKSAVDYRSLYEDNGGLERTPEILFKDKLQDGNDRKSTVVAGGYKSNIPVLGKGKSNGIVHGHVSQKPVKKEIEKEKEKEKEKNRKVEQILPNSISPLQAASPDYCGLDILLPPISKPTKGGDKVGSDSDDDDVVDSEENAWYSEKNLRRQLERQRNTDPVTVFGQVRPIDPQALFGSRGVGLSVEWPV
jgi:hypothetical protein